MDIQDLAKLIDKLESKIDEGNRISSDTLMQATKTNGRVNKVEDNLSEQKRRIDEQQRMLRFLGTSFFLFALTCVGFYFQHWLNTH